MTMPDVIYAYSREYRTGTWIDFDDSCYVTGDLATPYIRKDLADELARHLEDARANILDLINSRGSEAEGSNSDWVGDIDAILTRYNAATEGK